MSETKPLPEPPPPEQPEDEKKEILELIQVIDHYKCSLFSLSGILAIKSKSLGLPADLLSLYATPLK